MLTIHTLDLRFLGADHAIAAYAIPDDAGITLVECGPYSTHDHLLAALTAAGLDPDRVHTVLLTHIHFDHAGAAWWWAARGARIYVHPRGYKHLLDPSRLYGSAARLYGEANMARLWGKMGNIAPEQLNAVEDRETLQLGGLTWTAHHTPGHASHHVAWQLEDVVFTGDVGGVRIGDGPVVPPCPPPDIDVAAWDNSIERLRSLNAKTFYPTHYGAQPASEAYLDELQQRLHRYSDWMRGQLATEGDDAPSLTRRFEEMVVKEFRSAGLNDDVIAAYRAANPPLLSVGGLKRCIEKFG